MDKLKMHSPNLVDANIEKIAALFPNCITETKDENGELKKAIDFDLLKQELSQVIVEGEQERYRLDWVGKKEAILTANAPIAKTLRPCREESVNFDSTENLFIEGDNLEALKLLQENYLGKVKMIYIDPPYNTGNDFIYEDDFAENTEVFFEKSNQSDDDGNRLVANTETNGRFHSDWLSMMYSRLKLARNLLIDDGVIFISIDDNEVHNLRKICDEIFGSQNFEGHIHWRRRSNQPNDKTKMIGLVAEHILCYAKEKTALKKSGVGKIGLTGSFSNPDNDPKGDWASKPWKVGSDQSGSRYIITTPTGIVYDEEWMGEQSTYNNFLSEGRIYFPNNGNGTPRKKYYKFERENEGQCATNWWDSTNFGNNQEGNDTLTNLMDGIKNTFSNPKPVKLIKNLLSISGIKKDEIFMDFFLGSGTSFQAALEFHNQIKFIGVQISEPLISNVKEHQPAIEFCQKNNLDHILSEVTKERLRRVGRKLIEGNADRNDIQDLDIGFRVLKIDSTNMKDVYYTPDALKQSDMLDLASNIKEDRTSEDLLFQVMLDWGLELSLPIERKIVAGKEVFFVAGNSLVACFDDLTFDVVDEVAKDRPLRFVSAEKAIHLDHDKTNIKERFKQLSPDTEVKFL